MFLNLIKLLAILTKTHFSWTQVQVYCCLLISIIHRAFYYMNLIYVIWKLQLAHHLLDQNKWNTVNNPGLGIGRRKIDDERRSKYQQVTDTARIISFPIQTKYFGKISNFLYYTYNFGWNFYVFVHTNRQSLAESIINKSLYHKHVCIIRRH